MMLSVFLRTLFGLQVRKIALVVVIIAILDIGLAYLFGWLYDKKGMFSRELDFYWSRNRDAQEIMRRLKKLDEKLNKIYPWD